jgi:hypothetical protein
LFSLLDKVLLYSLDWPQTDNSPFIIQFLGVCTYSHELHQDVTFLFFLTCGGKVISTQTTGFKNVKASHGWQRMHQMALKSFTTIIIF